MSERYPGGFMTQSPPTPSASNTTGVWTLDQQQQLKQAGQWPANGPFYVEDVFSTWLYTGNGSTQTITNGIDLAGKGGLVWMKNRTNVQLHSLCDTVTGAGKYLNSASTAAQSSGSTFLQSFTSTGFSIGSTFNATGDAYVSWTFRKQPKFFDVVTWTGNGAASQQISHSLGSVPGSIAAKRTSSSWYWINYHRSLGNTQAVFFNQTTAATTSSAWWNNTDPTSSVFTVGSELNAAGETFVAYLFAHDAGGFGLTGTDNVISCGSFASNGGGAVAPIVLGYEPQLILMKVSNGTSNWFIYDNMRGLPIGYGSNLQPNLANAEAADAYQFALNPNGFTVTGGPGSSQTFIYIAIRRGPMRTPTTGTSVYSGVTFTGDSTVNRSLTAGFPPDLVIPKVRLNTGGSGGNTWDVDRLRGIRVLAMNATFDESVTSGYDLGSFNKSQTAFVTGTSTTFINSLGDTQIAWMFRRAPSFFDEVCYTGAGGVSSIPHNLTVIPELVIVKSRTTGGEWLVWTSTFAFNQYFFLNRSDARYTSAGAEYFGNSTPTASSFQVGPNSDTNGTNPFVAYLFATCPGVSKVGSYTGTGTTQTINCGFIGGSRFVLIKRTDGGGGNDWYVWDSARGIIAGNDPYLFINSAAIEVTNTDYIDTAATGFEITSTAPAAINANGGTFIFLAIA